MSSFTWRLSALKFAAHFSNPISSHCPCTNAVPSGKASYRGESHIFSCPITIIVCFLLGQLQRGGGWLFKDDIWLSVFHVLPPVTLSCHATSVRQKIFIFYELPHYIYNSAINEIINNVTLRIVRQMVTLDAAELAGRRTVWPSCTQRRHWRISKRFLYWYENVADQTLLSTEFVGDNNGMPQVPIFFL